MKKVLRGISTRLLQGWNRDCAPMMRWEKQASKQCGCIAECQLDLRALGGKHCREQAPKWESWSPENDRTRKAGTRVYMTSFMYCISLATSNGILPFH